MQHLPGVSCAIFPVHKILDLRSFLAVCNDSDSPQFLHLCDFARVLRSCNALPVLSFCPVAEGGMMGSDLMRQAALFNAQLRSVPNSKPYGAATSASWVARCIACTSSTAAGFHAKFAQRHPCCSCFRLRHVRLLPFWDLQDLRTVLQSLLKLDHTR